jgi:GntR family transcriptional repressor for pyruvate dehydrogenase complex
MTAPIFSSVGNDSGLVQRVVDEIKTMIVNGRIAPDTKLPPEKELGEQFGVSRTVIREAVQMLRAQGLVEPKQGVGTIVRRLTRAHVVEPLSLLVQIRSGGVTLEQLYQVRTLLEVEVAGLAARHATESDVHSLQDIVERLDAGQEELATFATCEADFHTALAHATGNPLLELLVGILLDLLEEYVRKVLVQLPEARPLYVARHRRITAQVIARDEARARQEMAEHLQAVRGTMDRLFSGEERVPSR